MKQLPFYGLQNMWDAFKFRQKTILFLWLLERMSKIFSRAKIDFSVCKLVAEVAVFCAYHFIFRSSNIYEYVLLFLLIDRMWVIQPIDGNRKRWKKCVTTNELFIHFFVLFDKIVWSENAFVTKYFWISSELNTHFSLDKSIEFGCRWDVPDFIK